jgi:regulator of RNase E activity RraA
MSKAASKAGGGKATAAKVDPFELRKYYVPLRVVDVCDALDGIGYFNVGLVDPAIRPLWSGMKFWGVAYTIRCVPANRPMWKLNTTEEIVRDHAIWFDAVGRGAFDYVDDIRPGHVIVMDVGSAESVGVWGSENTLRAMHRGAVGIMTNGECRDTAEVEMQRTPMVCKRRGRTIIPGRIQAIETQATIGFGGAQVRPGDIVGCDNDGVVVVPIEVAPEVAVHARAVMIADMNARRRHYERLGRPYDETVDAAAAEKYFADLERRATGKR